MTQPSSPLQFLNPGWFSIVMGLAGLGMAWHHATPLMGPGAGLAAVVLCGAGAVVFVLLALASALRLQRHGQAWAEDLAHPVRHPFVATIPISLMLLATADLALQGPRPLAQVLWWLGSLGQLGVTLWVLARWWRGNQAGGLQWASVTPALLIPTVGNVLVPLGGVPLGFTEWATAQFGIGLLLWPVVLMLMVTRVAVVGMWPERLRPTVFILIAPPAVSALALLQLGAPLALGWAMWGVALFSLLWAGTQTRAIGQLPFALPHWGMSFPLTAMAALTLRLAAPGGALVVPALALLALASLVIAALVLATLRGLRSGTLLAPEPVATIKPVSA